ncbi:phosphoadenosine phosphosulfate reductase family protein [uncultured Novosphingobium sp.]|uniref:phosphoadenosine phosphosulfate reductase family protein n=1 Tax=uncultured Novosphingobium sp. TaxID=292277 RepID=UPI002598EE66|nr:phosphoadenosine phosphosulfate reductase family protein [uncultured Novosphingobium sp.]
MVANDHDLAATALPGLSPLALPDEIREAVQQCAWIVFNLSGGKDSSAALFAVMPLLDRLGHPRERRLVIHADLGRAEWDTTPGMVERLAALAGLPLTVVRRAAGDLFDRWAQRFENGKRRYEALETYNLIGPWSSASLRFCTSEAKAQVIGPHLARTLRGGTIVNVLGIRRDESAARSKAAEWKADARHAAPGNAHGTAMMLWHPILHWSAGDVFAAHRQLGIPLHEAYTAYGSSRLSCRFCVLQSIADARASARAPANREALLHLVGLEASSTFSFQPGRWLADTAPALLTSELAVRIGEAKLAAERRRALEAAMPPDLRFVRGSPPRLPTLPEAEVIAAARHEILAQHGLANRFPTGRAVQRRFAQLHDARQAA